MSFIRKNWKWLVVAAVVAVVGVRLKLKRTPVETHTVRRGEIVAEVMGTGTLEARVKTVISPRIQEQLAEVLVDQNDFVRAGQLLARLDDSDLEQQVGVAEAALAAAEATAERVRVDETRAQAVEKQARLEHKRIAELLTTSVTSQADLDKAAEQLSVAEADNKRARAAIVEAESEVRVAERNLAYQRERLGYTRIVSPYDGLVVRRDRDPGGVVVPGGSLLQLVSTNEIWVSAWVDETAMAGLAGGQPARVVFRSEPGRSFPGGVARLGRETDRETREFLVDVRVRQLPSNWTLGQRAEVFIETGRGTNVLAIPQRFIRWRAGKPGVFVAESGKATWRDVTLGLRGRELVEITQGLSGREKVATTEGAKASPLHPGQRIKTK